MSVMMSDEETEATWIERVFPRLSKPLTSCRESIIECQADDCGDEPQPNDELCARHRRNEDAYYWDMERRRQLEEDRFQYDVTDRGMVG